jgi:hypothetical protein
MRTTRLRALALVAATAILMSCGDGDSVEPSTTPEPAQPGAWFVALVMPSDADASPAADGEILFRWNDNSDDESGFEIQRAKGLQGAFSLIARVKANVTQYLDSGLASDVEYCYRVRAFSGKGKNIQYSTFTAVDAACATTNATDPIGDPRPTNLTAMPGPSGGIDLAWEDNWDSETYYAIERCVISVEDCFYYGLALVAADQTTYTDTDVDLTSSLQYCYRVKGLQMKGKKAKYTEYSNVACAPELVETP